MTRTICKINFCVQLGSNAVLGYFGNIQYSHREIPISPARLGDTFCCLGDFLSSHRDNRYSQRDAQVTQRDVVTVHRA